MSNSPFDWNNGQPSVMFIRARASKSRPHGRERDETDPIATQMPIAGSEDQPDQEAPLAARASTMGDLFRALRPDQPSE